MPNFNDAKTQDDEHPESKRDAPHVDLDELALALASCAYRWVPETFPQGRIVDGVMHTANIRGAPPHKDGSCHIQMSGDNAGGWYDHSLGSGGGPISTIKEVLGLPS